MQETIIWKFIAENLQAGKPVALLAVLHHEGSSPGRQGFKMAITETGEMSGSIGGGIMEHKLVETARNLLKNGQNKSVFKRQIHSKKAPQNQSGMICSGEQTVAIYFLQPKDRPVIEAILQAWQTQNPVLFSLTPEGISAENLKAENADRFTFRAENDSNWHFTEKIPSRDRVYIIGGGHVGLALSKVLSLLNFDLYLFDDRPDLNTFHQNNFVNQKTIVNYPEIDRYIPEGDQSYVVIMTFGYRPDSIVLRELLGKNFKYLGLMGSEAKIDQMFDEYRAEGFSEEDLQKVYAPIGLPINSQTPEEIGISIAAQIIQVRNS